MTKESSLKEGDTSLVFDLDSQGGVMSLLSSVRSSDVTSEQKNELRDLIFLYANGGRDESVRITLDKKIESYSIKLIENESVKVQVPEPRKLAFGTSRPAPTFAPSSVSTASVEAVDHTAPGVVPVNEVVAPSVKKPKLTIESELPPDQKPPVTPVVESAPQVSLPEEPVAPPDPQNIPEVHVIPEPESPPRTEIVSNTTPAAEVPAVASAQSPELISSPENSLKRIREIKSIVNDSVGNPVNLVDIDNKVGREYMTSLLEAMKKLNSGTSMISAMKRLEESFVQVQKTLDAHKHTDAPASEVDVVTAPEKGEGENSVLTTEPRSESAPVSAPKVEPISSAEPELISEEKPVSASVPVAAVDMKPVVEVSSEFPAETQVTAVVDKVEPEPVLATKIDESEMLKTVPTVTTLSPKVTVVEKPVFTTEEEVKSAWDSVSAPSQPVVDRDNKIASLAESKVKLSSIDSLASASSVETSSVEGDNLFTKEVDGGLNQLLVEWSIFRKSGLFGTGPKGIEHPLYKKISELQIPLLLAGRFEGATQEIKQSITDYMNGWRYEQGIIYEQGENFGHYLRRVIRHILDLQKK